MRHIKRIVEGTPVADELIKHEAGTVVWSAESSSKVRLVLKLYRHRGLFHTLRGFVIKFRAQREFERLEYLIQSGVPCTAPYSWARGYSRQHGFYEILTTVMVTGTENLQSRLRQNLDIDLRPLFETVRRMHDSGFCHHALVARNILVRDSGNARCCYTISDVPRSRILPRSIVGSRLARLDLADLIADLRRRGIPDESIPIEAYGISEASKRRLERMIARHKRSKLRRTGRDIESRVRHLIAWGAAIIAAATNSVINAVKGTGPVPPPIAAKPTSGGLDVRQARTELQLTANTTCTETPLIKKDMTGEVTWCSEDPAIATVSNTESSKGLMRAVGNGPVGTCRHRGQRHDRHKNHP